MAFQPVDFNYFLARKYALQQQEADATTTNAGSSRIQAEANAGVAATQAKMNTVQTSLMPGESASQNALRRAQALLLGEQASVVRPESEANIGVSRANAALTGLQGQVLKRQSLTPYASLIGGGASLGPALGGVMGAGGFRFAPVSETKPPRLPGESQAAYMDRTGWGL